MISVLSVVPRMIYPAHSGGEIRVGALIRALAGRVRFTLVTFLESGQEAHATAAAMRLERDWGLQTVFARRGLPVGDWMTPDLARPYADGRMAEMILRTAREARADLVHLEFTQLAQYARSASAAAPVVLTEHDTSVLTFARSYVRGESAFRRAAERVRHEVYLRRALRHCARVVAVSDADAARLARLSPRRNVRVVPTGVDLARFPFRDLAGREAGRVAFVGHYPHFPNEDAAVFLCKRILPPLRRLRAEARVALVGSAPTPAVLALAADAVAVVGTVPEVAPELHRARVFIAPMRLGFGIKGKILEAFSAGTPVVATAQACEAMPGIADGVHALLARDAEGLAAAAARLLSDDALSRRLAAAAREYVERRFGWARQADLQEAVYREALEAAR